MANSRICSLTRDELQKMEYLLELWPGAGLERENSFLELVFIENQETGIGWHPDAMEQILQNERIDLKSWLIEALPRIIETGSGAGERCCELLMEKTRWHLARFLYDRETCMGLLVSRDPPDQRVAGWTSFLVFGHYFYSSTICLDPEAKKLTAGRDRGLVFSDGLYEDLSYPEEEQWVEIAYGRDYNELITIPAPVFLVNWYRDSGVNTKSAQTAR